MQCNKEHFDEKTLLGFSVAAVFATPTFAANNFGAKVDHLLKVQAFKYFGIVKSLAQSVSDHTVRQAGQPVSDVVSVATGLYAQFFTRESSAWADQIAFWPSSETATHLFTGVENFNPLTGCNGKSQPCVQRIDLNAQDGQVGFLQLTGVSDSYVQAVSLWLFGSGLCLLLRLGRCVS